MVMNSHEDAQLRRDMIFTQVIPKLDPDFDYDYEAIFDQCYKFDWEDQIYILIASVHQFYRTAAEFVLNPLNPNRDNQ